MRPIPPTNIRTYIAAVINYLPVSESQFTWTIRRLRVRLDVTVFAIPCATLLNFFVSVYFWVIFIRKPQNGSMYRNCVFSNIFISFRFVSFAQWLIEFVDLFGNPDWRDRQREYISFTKCHINFSISHFIPSCFAWLKVVFVPAKNPKKNHQVVVIHLDSKQRKTTSSKLN